MRRNSAPASPQSRRKDRRAGVQGGLGRLPTNPGSPGPGSFTPHRVNNRLHRDPASSWRAGRIPLRAPRAHPAWALRTPHVVPPAPASRAPASSPSERKGGRSRPLLGKGLSTCCPASQPPPAPQHHSPLCPPREKEAGRGLEGIKASQLAHLWSQRGPPLRQFALFVCLFYTLVFKQTQKIQAGRGPCWVERGEGLQTNLRT